MNLHSPRGSPDEGTTRHYLPALVVETGEGTGRPLTPLLRSVAEGTETPINRHQSKRKYSAFSVVLGFYLDPFFGRYSSFPASCLVRRQGSVSQSVRPCPTPVLVTNDVLVVPGRLWEGGGPSGGRRSPLEGERRGDTETISSSVTLLLLLLSQDEDHSRTTP